MKRNKKTYSVFQLASAIVMIFALIWLTVSAPFVNACQQELAKQKIAVSSNVLGTTEEEAGNPFGNTTEEKKPPSNSSVSEEYLHHHQSGDSFISSISRFYKSENAGVYTAFHGEILVPPPNIA